MPNQLETGGTLVLDGAEPEVTEPVLCVLRVVLLWESSRYPGWHVGSYALISAVETEGVREEDPQDTCAQLPLFM